MSSNAISVAASVELVLVMEKSRVTDPPAPTGSSVNAFVNTGAGETKRRSVARDPVTGAPPTSAVTELVVLG